MTSLIQFNVIDIHKAPPVKGAPISQLDRCYTKPSTECPLSSICQSYIVDPSKETPLNGAPIFLQDQCKHIDI